MAAETARQFEALERQAQGLMSVFTGAGYEAVAPAVIQPADVFLDVIGEDLRARTYVFTDPDGAELCLRPDLTVPTCLLHLARHSRGDVTARYCYNGSTFRFQPRGANAAHPNEFRQAGVELFAAPDREQAETEIVALILDALKQSGLTGFSLRIGDLGLFHAMLDSLELPGRWRQRLKTQFWRPDAFRTELKQLSTAPGSTHKASPRDIGLKLDPDDRDGAVRAVAQHLESAGIELFGSRTVAEIADSLLAAAADAKAHPIPAATAQMIEDYLAISGSAPAAAARIETLLKTLNGRVLDALDRYRRRLDLLAKAGIDVETVSFSAEFGRNLEYYTGFVFEVVTDMLGPLSPVAGGGRYDNLLRTVGASADVPAVGSAIHTERLLSAVNGGRP